MNGRRPRQSVGTGLRNGLCFALLLKIASGEIKRGEIGMLWELYVLASDAKNIGFLPDVLVLLLLFKLNRTLVRNCHCVCHKLARKLELPAMLSFITRLN